VASTTRAGLGQSLCIGMGGDVLAGTNFVDALKIFEHDDETEGIVLIGEIGGEAEIEAAEWIKDYKQRSPNPKYVSETVSTGHILILGQAHICTHWWHPRGSRESDGPCGSIHLTRRT
jgi:succinyl-CoA synthetase alpha subunit